jgi:uncharacterized membrane protein
MPGARDPFIKPWMVELAEDDFELDITRARKLLDWEPKRRLRDALPAMVAALKADPVGWYHENKLDPPTWLKAAAHAAPREEASRADDGADEGDAAPHDEMDHGAMSHAAMAHDGAGQSDMAMDGEAMLEEHHQRMLWAPFAVAVLGLWLASSPFVLGHAGGGLGASDVAHVTALRGLPPIAARGMAMLWSDVLSGILLVAFALLSLEARRLWAPWAASAVGVWLLFAPLVFWAPTAAAYGNDALVGILVIALALLIPGMPGMMLMMQPGPEIPPGWSYNPSAWVQRAPIIALGWIGFFLSRHLAAYQLGYVHTAWDPIFGSQTARILDSELSRAWPISDAGLGTLAYTIEALMGYMGGTDRWRTMPWMVTFFGILVVPLGAVSIFLVMMQPVAVGAWCTLCLATALAMLLMIPLTLDEVVAMVAFLVRSRRDGKPFWRTFWMGGTTEGGDHDERSPRLTESPTRTAPAMVWGVTAPWPLLAAAALGVWVLASPDLLGLTAGAADQSHIAGALVTTFAVTAMAEVGRALRLLNIPLGVWIALTPWIFSGAPPVAHWSGAVAGLLVIALSLPKGAVRERYGAWQRFVV